MNDDVRDLTISYFTNILYSVTAFLFVAFISRVTRHARNQDRPQTDSMIAFAVAELLREIRLICGFAALVLLFLYVAEYLFSNVILWKHVLGWMVIATAGAVAVCAYLDDPPRQPPGGSDRVIVWANRAQRGVDALIVVVIFAMFVNIIYFNQGIVKLRMTAMNEQTTRSPATQPAATSPSR